MKILHLCLANFYIDNYSYQENMLPKFHKKLGYEVEIIASMQSFDRNGVTSFIEKSSYSYINENGIKVTRLQYKHSNSQLQRFRHYIGTKGAVESASPDIIFFTVASLATCRLSSTMLSLILMSNSSLTAMPAIRTALPIGFRFISSIESFGVMRLSLRSPILSAFGVFSRLVSIFLRRIIGCLRRSVGFWSWAPMMMK